MEFALQLASIRSLRTIGKGRRIWLKAIIHTAIGQKGNSHPLCSLGNKGKYYRTISMHGINSSPVHIETPCNQVAKQLLPKCKLEPRFFLRYFIPSNSAVHIKVIVILGSSQGAQGYFGNQCFWVESDIKVCVSINEIGVMV